MNFELFRRSFVEQRCFTSWQVYAWYPDFDKNNLWRWTKKGYLIKLRQGYYMFSESRDLAGINFYLANCIYKPSYISLQTALSYYGLIPEAVADIISITTLKTALFENSVGVFSYKKIKDSLFTGFKHIEFDGEKIVLFASPEKALLDFLYFYPFYNTEKSIFHLRLNEDILTETVDFDKLDILLSNFKSKNLEKRIRLLKKVYSLSI